MEIKMFDKIRLKSGENAHIVEIYEPKVAYEADIYDKDGHTRTDTIKHSDIAGVIVEVVKPLSELA